MKIMINVSVCKEDMMTTPVLIKSRTSSVEDLQESGLWDNDLVETSKSPVEKDFGTVAPGDGMVCTMHE